MRQTSRRSLRTRFGFPHLNYHPTQRLLCKHISPLAANLEEESESRCIGSTVYMRYLEIDLGPQNEDEKIPWWAKLLIWILPAANPDLETDIGKARIWWLEIDDEGSPQREIGFDIDGTPIVLGPIEGNFGYLIDASDDWSDSDADSLEAAKKFNQVWISLWPKFAELDQRNRPKEAP